MGKYSLESYERYKMTKCRPEEVLEPREGAGYSRFTTVRAALDQRPEPESMALIAVRITREDLDCAAEAESRLRSLASAYCAHPLVLGVVLSVEGCSAMRRRLWEAAAEAFAPKRFFVPVTDGEQLDYALRRGLIGGLLAEIGENPYDTCEAFAEQNAQQLYKRMPVLVRCGVPAPRNAAAYAQQWHASYTENIPDALAGWRIALRRLNYPRQLSSGGFAPLQFWWTNRGPAYYHGRPQVCLRLVGNGCSIPVALNDCPPFIHLADRVYNDIIRLPEAPAGQYRVEYAILDEDRRPLVLCHAGRTPDGWYPAGFMNLDDIPRPEYEHIWDDYAADGYYPLEDPKVPGT